ncbi:ribbon-helix-helix protein, CopG family [Euzebya rosea]|uniref:ribbon-helix-helix protein, CopG family n=1 Tax=Euzebya rosea TaxID=2052804 RepID=UPI000D3E2F12|nr:ribbon-helix-helix protein, CopG family [Euzebya rosea]
MRTTVELTDASHEAISNLARRRGSRGLSEIVQTAVDLYLASLSAEEVEAVLGLEGSISEESAASMTAAMEESRGQWRTTA